MKKKTMCLIAIVIISIIIMGSGCTNTVIENVNDHNTIVSSMFVIVEETNDWLIVYHKDNKVMYSVSDTSGGYNGNGVFTLLVNPDGTPLLYEGQ